MSYRSIHTWSSSALVGLLSCLKQPCGRTLNATVFWLDVAKAGGLKVIQEACGAIKQTRDVALICEAARVTGYYVTFR
jgi:hypothetical protein